MRNAKYPIYALNNTTQNGCSQRRDALSVTYSVTVTLITPDITKKQSKFFLTYIVSKKIMTNTPLHGTQFSHCSWKLCIAR